MNDNFVRPLNDASIFEHQLDYWTPQNTDARYPRILNKSDANHNYENSDYWMINAGYLRMKNLTLDILFLVKFCPLLVLVVYVFILQLTTCLRSLILCQEWIRSIQRMGLSVCPHLFVWFECSILKVRKDENNK